VDAEGAASAFILKWFGLSAALLSVRAQPERPKNEALMRSFAC
jgi:hypothetical protein